MSLAQTTITFRNGNRVRAIFVDKRTPAQQIVSRLQLPRPRALVILNGTTDKIEPRIRSCLASLLQDGLARIAAEEQLTLITGGTWSGIFALLGEGLAIWGRRGPCIGVTVGSRVTWPGRIKVRPPLRWLRSKRTPLEAHHSHFVLVEGRRWGDETGVMYELAGELAKGCPSLALFAGGGKVTLDEMERNVDQGRKMVLLVGSGRVTDAIGEVLVRKEAKTDRIVRIAEHGDISLFDVREGEAALRQLIQDLLIKGEDSEHSKGDQVGSGVPRMAPARATGPR